MAKPCFRVQKLRSHGRERGWDEAAHDGGGFGVEDVGWLRSEAEGEDWPEEEFEYVVPEEGSMKKEEEEWEDEKWMANEEPWGGWWIKHEDRAWTKEEVDDKSWWGKRKAWSQDDGCSKMARNDWQQLLE